MEETKERAIGVYEALKKISDLMTGRDRDLLDGSPITNITLLRDELIITTCQSVMKYDRQSETISVIHPY